MCKAARRELAGPLSSRPSSPPAPAGPCSLLPPAPLSPASGLRSESAVHALRWGRVSVAAWRSFLVLLLLRGPPRPPGWLGAPGGRPPPSAWSVVGPGLWPAVSPSFAPPCPALPLSPMTSRPVRCSPKGVTCDKPEVVRE
jgi:hypothetical protein